MDIKQKTINARGIKFFIEEDGKEIARAFLFVIKNDLHDQPYGLLEDVYVDEAFRGRGLGTRLTKQVITAAKENKCYKLIATSRTARVKVHELYEKLGFKNYGIEFRMDF